MSSSEKEVRYRLTLEGSAQVSKGAMDAATALKSTAPAANQASTAFKTLGGTLDTSRGQMSLVRSGVMMFTATLGESIPELRPFAAGISHIASSVGGLSSALGITATGAVGAAGLLLGLKLFRDYMMRASEAIKEFDKLAAKSIEERNRQNKADLTGKELWKEKLDLIHKMNAGEAEAADFARARKLAVDGQINYTQEQIALIEKETLARNKETKSGAEWWKVQGEIADEYGSMAESARSAAKEEEAAAAARNRMIGEAKELVNPAGLSTESQRALKDLEAQYSTSALDAFINEKAKLYEEDAKIFAEAEKKKQEEIQATAELERDTAMQAIGVVAQTSARALQDLIKGKKVELAAITETIGDGLFADGLSNVLKAGAMAWIPGLQANAVGLLEAGSAEMLMGGMMGAIGARGQGGSNAAMPSSTAVTRQRDQYEGITPVSDTRPIVIRLEYGESGEVLVNAINSANSRDTSVQITGSAVRS